MKPTFAMAMTAYAVFALVTWFAISEPRIRYAVWILLAGLALKTWIARAARW